jgi:hypothetical protein
MGWSEWIYAKVSTALNIDQISSDNDTCENKKIYQLLETDMIESSEIENNYCIGNNGNINSSSVIRLFKNTNT